MIIVIDNYDSFTYNLVQYLGDLGQELLVYRNDRISIAEIEKINPKHIVISPGPGIPQKAGISIDLIKHFAGKIPILGVCLGHQAIGAAFGANIIGAPRIMHGKSSRIFHKGHELFSDIPSPFRAIRYHSLVIDPKSLPESLDVTAETSIGEIMGVRHKEHQIFGIQFHPESIMTENGKVLISNFLKMGKRPMIKNMLNKVVDGQDLSHEEMMDAMDIIMSGGATSAQISGFITALRMKGETVDEISGAASVMREKATKISPKLPNGGILIDTCGTGGDGSQTFNISTAAALVAAGCGAYIAKHGNRAVSSKCGSADVLEALGINISIPPSRVESCIEEIGIGFLFAPLLHGAMKNAIGPRKELGIRTIFNILGPLTNPATATGQLLGVYDPNLCEVMARVLAVLGSKEAMIVHGDGHDEITTTGKTNVSHLKDGKISNYTIEPEQFGMQRASREELSGGDPKYNAEIIEKILDGELGPRTDVVILNAAAGLMVSGIAPDFGSAIELATESVKSGRAKRKLADLREFTNDMKQDL